VGDKDLLTVGDGFDHRYENARCDSSEKQQDRRQDVDISQLPLSDFSQWNCEVIRSGGVYGRKAEQGIVQQSWSKKLQNGSVATNNANFVTRSVR